MKRRIESTTSRTAEITCISRAMSSLEANSFYRSDDHIAVLLLPSFFRLLVHIPFFRMLFSRKAAPKGIYEYVITRTKYIDSVFTHALAEKFGQIAIFGAEFDTRALRFITQQATQTYSSWTFLSRRMQRSASTANEV